MGQKFKNLHMPVAIILAVLVLSVLLFFCFHLWQTEHKVEQQAFPLYQDNASFKRKVLFISSYHDTFETVMPQRMGLLEVFQKHNVQMDTAYMDTKNYPTEENVRYFHDVLSYKLKHQPPYDAVVLGDDAALLFAEKYQEELFPGIPMVFICVNDRNTAERAANNPLITGAVENYYLEDTIDLARNMCPRAVNIIGIYDDTPPGIGDYAEFMEVAESYPECDFTGIDASKLTRGEFAARLAQISADSIVFFLDAHDDKDGNRYGVPETARLIAECSPVPVFRALEGAMGEGIIGGKMVDFRASGRWAANVVMNIFNGGDIKTMPLELEGESSYVFDAQVMEHYGIPESILPEGTKLIRQEPSFWNENRSILIPTIGVVAILLLLLLIALRNYERVSRMSQKLTETIELLDYQSMHDALTRLPNRQAAEAEFKRRILRHQDFTTIIVDMDNFKKINDFYSHSIGNELLKVLAQRIRERFLRVYRGSYAARIGGDEFILVLPELLEEENTEKLEKILDIFREPIVHEERVVPLSASIGIIRSNDEELNTTDLIFANADIALVDAKQFGKNQYVFYRSETKRSLQRANEVENILRSAIEKEEFKVLYQPQVNADTQKMHGFEALARLSNADVYPGEFIPVAENTGLIVQVGRIITKKVIQQLAKWRDEGHPLYQVAINYSCGQLADESYPKYLGELMKEYKIPSDLIEIEVTESLFIANNKQAHDLFIDFAAMGVKMALDDFGTGYSSLSYLTYLPVDVVKIDKALMDTYLQDEMEDFMKNLVKLIHSLNMKIVVEGVEHVVQFEKLKRYHADIIQGYYFSRPMPAEEAIQFDPSHPQGEV